VGAHNSGTTSAVDALRKFLIKGDGNNFIYNSLLVVNLNNLRKISETWVKDDAQKPTDSADWVKLVPSYDASRFHRKESCKIL
jgi:hypothetical protein